MMCIDVTDGQSINQSINQSVTWRGIRNSFLGFFVQRDDTFQHANGLGQRTHVIVLGESVLVQEVFDDHVGHVHDHLQSENIVGVG